MIRRLAPDVPLHPDETLHSWVARLAALHTGLGTDRLLDDLGFDRTRLGRGGDDVLDVLAEVTGTKLDRLRAATISVRLRDVLFRGEDFARSSLSPRVDRVCPSCLAEDGDRTNLRHRLTWCFRVVRWCIRHGTPLHATTQGPAHDVRAVGIADPVVGGKGRSEPPAFAAWIDDRMRSVADASPWRATQTMEQVLAASEMLGAVLLHGHGVRPAHLSDAQREDAMEEGFDILGNGPKEITRALDDIRSSSTATAVQAGPLAMYGRLYDWLDRRANHLDPGAIKDLLRDHIVVHSAVAPGDVVLGQTIAHRRSHTIESLREATGVERRRLGRLPVRLGHVPPDASDAEAGRLVFPAEQLETFCADLANAIPLHDVPAYVMATRHQVAALYAARVFEPLVPPTGPGDVRNVVSARRHLDGLLDRISTLPLTETIDADAAGSVPEACRRGAGPMVPLFARFLAGEVPAARIPGEPGFARIVVRFADVADRRCDAA